MGSTILPPQSSHIVFVYGSLLADEVVSVILKRVPHSSPAILDGYRRFSVEGRVYPAITPVEDKKVNGKVLFGITDPELDLLDAFEDVEYERNTVDAFLICKFIEAEAVIGRSDFCNKMYRMLGGLQDTCERVQTYTYVWKEKNDPHLYGDWDIEAWRQVHMSDFLKMTTGFIEEFEGLESKPRVATYEEFFHQAESPPTL
ncbi:hypothetical protein IFM89_026067 [Coptis chinensis]|uniref:Putative gamma-glutamylcyclotransferase n=1 Tax=Coptis chinensis TaxID=261450 RepID=A0A835M1N6_9MAGN|nr:hypothetical protein IFM89_026067 [Coptis chinensis]